MHYVAVIEESGPDQAVGVWFPDLPGCFSAGDDVDEAIRNAGEAILLYAEALARAGRALPAPRTLTVLKSDPGFTADIQGRLVALIAEPERVSSAAE